jgi:chemotaxis protein CheD
VDTTVNVSDAQAQIVVDVAHLAVCRNPDAVLVAHALGSCMGVTVWDPVAKVAGLLRYMLPESRVSPRSAKSDPAMFCDTGVPRLFHAAYELGASKRRMVVKVAGGSQLLDEKDAFRIGRRNYLALRKILWKNNVSIEGEHVGGSISRTLQMDGATGAVTVRMWDKEVGL